MLLPPWQYRGILESPELMAKCWFPGGLGNPTFAANPWAIQAQTEMMKKVGSNWYAPQTPGSVLWAAAEFLQNMFGVNIPLDVNELTGEVRADGIKVSTSGTRCWPGYISVWHREKHGIPMNWLAEKPGYPGHSVVINKFGGRCRRVGGQGQSYIDILEEMERKMELDRYHGIIVQAVSNPTAEVSSPEIVKRYVTLAQRTGKLVLFDGAYQCVTAGDPVPSPLAGIDCAASNIVCLYSTSKGDQYAALGYGFGYGDLEWLKAFDEVQSAAREGGNLACYAALEACLRHPNFLKETSRGYSRLGGYFRTAMGEAGVEVPEWKGSIFSYFRIPETYIASGKNSFDFALALMERGVLFYPDLMFFDSGENIRASLVKGLEQKEVRTRLTETVSSLVRGRLVTQ